MGEFLRNLFKPKNDTLIGGSGTANLYGGAGRDPVVSEYLVDNHPVGSAAMPESPSYVVPGSTLIEDARTKKMRKPTAAELRDIERQTKQDDADYKRWANSRDRQLNPTIAGERR